MWATLPSPATMLAAITVWADPVFQSFLPIAYFVVGISVGILLIVLVIAVFRNTFWKFVNHTNLGARVAKLPGVPALDRWSFRGSKEYKRMMADV